MQKRRESAKVLDIEDLELDRLNRFWYTNVLATEEEKPVDTSPARRYRTELKKLVFKPTLQSAEFERSENGSESEDIEKATINEGWSTVAEAAVRRYNTKTTVDTVFKEYDR